MNTVYVAVAWIIALGTLCLALKDTNGGREVEAIQLKVPRATNNVTGSNLAKWKRLSRLCETDLAGQRWRIEPILDRFNDLFQLATMTNEQRARCEAAIAADLANLEYELKQIREYEVMAVK